MGMDTEIQKIGYLEQFLGHHSKIQANLANSE